MCSGFAAQSSLRRLRTLICGRIRTDYWIDAHVNEMKNRDQRVKVPPGIGAGNGAADCCGDCAEGADSAGGAVVRRRTTFLALGGGGGAAAVLPSSSGAASGSGAAAGSVLAVAGCLFLPLDFAARFDFGSSDGGAEAAAAAPPRRRLPISGS